MNAQDNYAVIKSSLNKIKTLSMYLHNMSDVSDDVKEHWNLCLHTLERMEQLAECLIENCNKTAQTIKNMHTE